MNNRLPSDATGPDLEVVLQPNEDWVILSRSNSIYSQSVKSDEEDTSPEEHDITCTQDLERRAQVQEQKPEDLDVNISNLGNTLDKIDHWLRLWSNIASTEPMSTAIPADYLEMAWWEVAIPNFITKPTRGDFYRQVETLKDEFHVPRRNDMIAALPVPEVIKFCYRVECGSLDITEAFRLLKVLRMFRSLDEFDMIAPPEYLGLYSSATLMLDAMGSVDLEGIFMEKLFSPIKQNFTPNQNIESKPFRALKADRDRVINSLWNQEKDIVAFLNAKRAARQNYEEKYLKALYRIS